MSINLGDYLDPNAADQLSADHLLSGPRVVTISSVRVYRDGKGKSRVELGLEEFDVPYRPCLTMGRVLDKVWGGKDASTRYIGRKILLFNDTSVTFGSQKTGGVRIKGLSHIDKPTTAEGLTAKKGVKSSYTVEPLNEPPPITQADVTEFEQRITNAGSVHELDVIAGDLKARDLGSHRGHLQTAWSERRKIVSADVVADDGQLPMGATDEGE